MSMDLARGHAAANGFRVSIAVPAPYAHAMASGVIGPHGYRLADALHKDPSRRSSMSRPATAPGS
jgi:hypothetical protein